MSLYLVSQIFVIVSIILLGLTYFLKDKTKILVLCLFYCIFYGLHYLMLGALTGMMMNLVSFIRNYYFYKNSKKNQKNSILILIILSSISLMFCAITYEDAFSIISMIASILSTYSIWQDDIRLYKILAIPVSICFIIYAFHINSIAAIITETALLIVELVALLKLYFNNKTLTMYNKKYKI